MADDERLALNGGMPVRSESFDTAHGVGYLDDDELNAAVEVLKSRSLFRYYGPEFLDKSGGFEAELRERFSVEHAVAVSSGTAALQAGLVGLGVEEGDEVIVPAVTFIATVGAVVNARAVPVFAEVDESLNLDPASFEENITDKTTAVVPVHLINAACDMDPIMEIAKRRGIRVLEDAAQAAGVSYRGRPVGTIGDAGAFSLQLEKNITSGEGGFLLTNDFQVFDRAVRYQDQGGQFTTSKGDVREHSSGDPFIGTNLRITEIASAIASVQLGRMDEIVSSGRERARQIRQRLGDIPVDWRTLPHEAGEGGSVTFYLRDAAGARQFGKALRAEGIPAGQIYGGKPVYANPAVLEQRTPWSKGCPFNCELHPTARRYYMGLCPRSEDLLGRSVGIAVGPRMTDADVDDIVRSVRKVAHAYL
ncbi:MAG: DegT/DnrJ/EryC1/StrS family aminotransferase [Dehalococcoidia bacterium]